MILLLQVLYSIAAVGLALVGFNTLILSILYLIHRQEISPKPDQPGDAEWPAVVVQLPVYNERHVVDRLVEAVSRLDYPRDRLVVQLLDDSTDDTVIRSAAAVERARANGVQIEHVRRPARVGFKAGALAYGLTLTDAPFVAIFDADFVPQPDFLRRVVPYFLTDGRLGMVQTRWAHLNDTQSNLTRAQALALDAHFAIEQTARHRSGLLMNFSGTAGVWRRACIEDSGGWQHDTLSEDIDLSYRAQLRGWRFLYLPDVSVPAEIPPLMMGFKRQQSRWATGTVQCLRKLGGVLLRSELNVWQKVQGLLHLGGYFLHPLLLLLLLLTLPLLLTGHLHHLPLAGLGVAMLGSPLQAVLAQRRLYPDWKRRLLYFPVFMLMGIGIAISNAAAVARAFSAAPLSFQRTPKFHVHGPSTVWASSAYTLPLDMTTVLELAAAAYAGVLAVLAISRLPALAPFMVLYSLGFGYVAGLSLWQARAAHRARTRRQHMLELPSTSR